MQTAWWRWWWMCRPKQCSVLAQAVLQEHFLLHQPAMQCRPCSKSYILQNGETSAGTKKPSWGNGWIFRKPTFVPFPLQQRVEHKGVHRSFFLGISQPSHSVLHSGDAFRRHLRHALERNGFYADPFSQCIYWEPHVPSSGPGHRTPPAQ